MENASFFDNSFPTNRPTRRSAASERPGDQAAALLLPMLERDLGPGHRHGRWVMFHCPFPGHAHGDAHASLGALPEKGRWRCFTCGRHGDALSWLMQRHGLPFSQACRALGLTSHASPAPGTPSHAAGASQPLSAACPTPEPPGGAAVALQTPITASPTPPAAAALPATSYAPPQAWQQRATTVAAEAEQVLWSPVGANPLAYLHHRGLRDDILRRWHIGYLPTDRYELLADWGLDPQPGRSVWLPHGILIPHRAPRNQGGGLWGLNIRRHRLTPKYVKVRGSRPTLLGPHHLSHAPVVLICEGEMDAMLLEQEIGDAIAVVTLGSAAHPWTYDPWGLYLIRASLILACFDNDPAGQAAAQRLQQTISLAVIMHLPHGKDITEFYLSGGNLWEWVKSYIHL